MYAIIKNGSQQFKVTEGDTIKVDLIASPEGSPVAFNEIIMAFNDKNELQYRGRLEASQQQLIPNAKKELLDAMLQIAETGIGPKDQIPSIGCSIKWKE